MPEIKQLTPNVVNKIAAGEVVERPASVVKELLENSVDAGATRIDISIEKGGTDLIRVADNGCGIAPEQLHLALASHATSKIRSDEDLFRVGTLGFRGEALASISSVSQFTLRSRTPESDSGAEVVVSGGHPEPIAPCGCPVGTITEVRNLFFNTPARRKFLRTTQTEMSHCSEALTRIALANEGIHFSMKHNDRVVSELPATDSWRERIAALFGREISESLIAIESGDGPIRLRGFVARPEQNKASSRTQYVLLNGRHIRDRALLHALGEAYRGLLTVGRHPIAFLRLDMPPQDVDVNVHPTKLEVRFQESGRIYSQLLGTLRTRFLTTDLTAHVQPTSPDEDRPSPAGPTDPMGLAPEAESRALAQFLPWGDTGSSAPGRYSSSPSQDALPAVDAMFESRPGKQLELTRLDRPIQWSKDCPATSPAQADTDERSDQQQPSNIRVDSAHGMPRPAAIQIHDRYLISEDREGVVVVDQHALHERILFQRLKARVASESLESQKLLVPEPVALSPVEATAAIEARELLQKLGITIEPFGGDTILVSSYPALLANLGPAEIFRQMIDRLTSGDNRADLDELLDDMLHDIACKAAIKAGDRLSPEEVESLLAQRHDVESAHHCPHGRPTTLVFTREELDRRFKRT